MASNIIMRVCSSCSTSTPIDETGRYCPECGAGFPEDKADPTGATAVLSADPGGSLIGTTIDHQFIIDGVLGGGSFGTVYRGRQLGLDRHVALKVPTAEISTDPVMARRFAREARSAARVHHPGVVAIYAVGTLPDGRPYLAMEMISGTPLDTILADGKLPPLRALAIARDVASALSETHAADVIHRDLKPSNIVWRRDRNGDDRITLVDFGIAVCKPGNADASRLTANGLIGTPHYMSPEQAHGEQVDSRSDLYSLGCILFELLTGETPFDGSGFEVLLAHLGRPVPVPSERVPELPACVDRIIAKLLAKKPDERCQTADELVVRLDEAIAELEGHARLRPKTARSSGIDRVPRRSRWWIGAAVAAIALGAAGFAAYQLVHSDPAVADDEPARAGGDEPARKTIATDNGTMTMKLTVPDPIIARAEVTARIELWDKLGHPVQADSVVVTVEDETGNARGFAATPRRKPGNFGFHYAFPRDGAYVIRVFPSTGDGEIQTTVHAVR